MQIYYKISVFYNIGIENRNISKYFYAFIWLVILLYVNLHCYN